MSGYSKNAEISLVHLREPTSLLIGSIHARGDEVWFLLKLALSGFIGNWQRSAFICSRCFLIFLQDLRIKTGSSSILKRTYG
jgi:hypothetical protein